MLHVLALSAALSLLQAPADKPFVNDPAASALYQQMVHSMRAAKSLSWVATYTMGAKGMTFGTTSYKIWLRKPNYARIESISPVPVGGKGEIVLDGKTLWTYWPEGKPQYPWEATGKRAAEYAKYKRTFYMKQPAPLARHSLSHATAYLFGMTILDPSTFHGYTDSLQPYLDGARSLGSEKVGDEDCAVIEVSFMKYQRSWTLWLAKKDHLPRKLRQVVRVSYDIVADETWTNVAANQNIPLSKFAWTPPKGWKEWSMPPIEEGLLTAGTPAPDFELSTVDGAKVKLSDFRGQVVWLHHWRCG